MTFCTTIIMFMKLTPELLKKKPNRFFPMWLLIKGLIIEGKCTMALARDCYSAAGYCDNNPCTETLQSLCDSLNYIGLMKISRSEVWELCPIYALCTFIRLYCPISNDRFYIGGLASTELCKAVYYNLFRKSPGDNRLSAIRRMLRMHSVPDLVNNVQRYYAEKPPREKLVAVVNAFLDSQLQRRFQEDFPSTSCQVTRSKHLLPAYGASEASPISDEYCELPKNIVLMSEIYVMPPTIELGFYGEGVPSPTKPLQNSKYVYKDAVWAKVGRYGFWPCFITGFELTKVKVYAFELKEVFTVAGRSVKKYPSLKIEDVLHKRPAICKLKTKAMESADLYLKDVARRSSKLYFLF